MKEYLEKKFCGDGIREMGKNQEKRAGGERGPPLEKTGIFQLELQP